MILNNVTLLHIYYYLDLKTLLSCALANKQCNRVFNSNLLWKQKIIERYGHTYIDHIRKEYNTDQLKIVYRIIGDLAYIKKYFELKYTIEDISSRKHISLYHGNITFRMRELRSLNVTKLKLRYNAITKVSTEICNLVNLTYLSLRGNHLRVLTREIKILTNLHTLDVSYNNLQSVPKEIDKLTNLVKLKLNSNKMQSLPKNIGNLVNLEELVLNDNKLESLPKEIGNLVNLRELVLNYNKLESLPKEIGNLMNLRKLKLYRNELHSLPKEIGNLTELYKLHVAGNPLTEYDDLRIIYWTKFKRPLLKILNSNMMMTICLVMMLLTYVLCIFIFDY